MPGHGIGERSRSDTKQGVERDAAAMADHRSVEIDEDGADFRQGDFEALQIGGFEGALQLVALDIHRRKFDGEEMALPLELHLGTMEGDDRLDLDGLAREKRPSRFGLRLKNALHETGLDRLHGAVYGADEIVPEIGDDA